jgi:hypothetical protein
VIHYALCCAADHGFDAWFRDSAAFDLQAEQGLLSCPTCGDRRVRRALMAPALASARSRGDAPRRGDTRAGETGAGEAGVSEPSGDGPEGGEPAALPDALRARLQRLRAEVERHTEDVGAGFAREARRIHAGDAPVRAIRGEATPDDARALAEDGVPVLRIPWIPRAEG